MKLRKLLATVSIAALIAGPVLAAPPVTITGPDGTQAAVTAAGVKVDATFGGAVTVTAVPDTATVTGTIANNTDTVILTTTGGYGTFGVTVTGTGTGAMQVSGSQDCTNYAVTTALPLANGNASNVISANGTYKGNMGGLKCIKISGLSISGGTYTVKISGGIGISSVSLTGLTLDAFGNLNVTCSGTNCPAPLQQITPVVSSATEACRVFKAGAGEMFGFTITTTGSATSNDWVMVFNSTTAPGDGAVTPVEFARIGPNQQYSYAVPPGMTLNFSTGITVCLSTTGPFTKTAEAQAVFSGKVQ